MKKILIIALSFMTLVFVGCSQGSDLNTNEDIIVENTNNINSDIVDFTHLDYQDKINSAIKIENEDAVLITESGAYEFAGDYSSITVNVDKTTDSGTVYLVLNEVSAASDTDTPLNITEAEDVVIILIGENTVNQGKIETVDEEFLSGAVHSNADTLITGEGSLIVNTLYKDGINSRDDLIIQNTNITVNAIEHGIEGKDLLAIDNSNINVTSNRDGLRTSNDEDLEKGNLIINSGNFVINTLHDGIAAENLLQIEGGTFDITTGGGFVEVLNEITKGEGSGDTISATDLLEDSMRSLKGTNITINGGVFLLNSYEDTIHANGVLVINDGVFNIISGDDAIHADTDLIINSAEILVENGYEGIEGETVTINGGNINITVLDDAMNANSDTGFIKITGGTIYLKSQGDGIDSNGDLIIEGGDIVIDVDAIYSGGDSELDVSGAYTISGGSVTDENGNEVSQNTNGPGGFGGGMAQPNNRPGGNRP